MPLLRPDIKMKTLAGVLKDVGQVLEATHAFEKRQARLFNIHRLRKKGTMIYKQNGEASHFAGGSGHPLRLRRLRP